MKRDPLAVEPVIVRGYSRFTPSFRPQTVPTFRASLQNEKNNGENYEVLGTEPHLAAIYRGRLSAHLAAGVLKDGSTGELAKANEAGAIHRQSALRDGLHKLMGTAKYPAQATPRRSSLSRVSENSTHGLNGDIRNALV